MAKRQWKKTAQPAGKYFNLVVSLKDGAGNPIADVSGVTVSVTDSVYSQVYGFGELLADNMKTGSFVLQMDAGDPEAIKRYSVTIKHSELRDTILSLIYIPQGTAYISGIEAVTGGTEIGSQLTAGKVQFHGTPENQTVTYVWMRADDVDGPYTVIEGASSSVYVLTEADSGKYICAAAYADQVRVGGFAVPAKRLRKVVFQPAAGAAPAGFFSFP